MNDSPIINTHDLAKILAERTPRIIDCRFNLGDPNWGRENYLLGHIPGALYAHLNLDLSGQVNPETGRHPLPAPEAFINKLNRWGITPEIAVVVYDTAGGAFASRLWFMLRAVGHKHVQVLDGGFQKWLADGYPVRMGHEDFSPIESSSVYPKNYNPQMLAALPEIEAALNNSALLLIDARAPERYQGVQEPIDPIAGHIPGAVNRFHGSNLTSEGIFKPKETLREELLDLLGNHSADQAVVYCGSGATSCHHLIAFELAGLTGVRLYAGSWSEWIRSPSRPVAKGPK